MSRVEEFGLILWSGGLGILRWKEVCAVSGGCGCLGLNFGEWLGGEMGNWMLGVGCALGKKVQEFGGLKGAGCWGKEGRIFCRGGRREDGSLTGSLSRSLNSEKNGW